MICCIHLTMLMYIRVNLYLCYFFKIWINGVILKVLFVINNIYSNTNLMLYFTIQNMFYFYLTFCCINLQNVVEQVHSQSNFTCILSTTKPDNRCIFLSRAYKPIIYNEESVLPLLICLCKHCGFGNPWSININTYTAINSRLTVLLILAHYKTVVKGLS